ncbi:MAG: HAD family hydrolase [Caldilineaceae bacterium]
MGERWRSLAQIDTVVFDKTGTLTLEQPTVSRIHCYNGVAEPEILRYAAAAEAKQSHPIARAIVQTAREHGLDLPRLEDAHYKVGYGLKTQIEGCTTRIGSVRFMTLEGIRSHRRSPRNGRRAMRLAIPWCWWRLKMEVVGAIELQPTIRPGGAPNHQRTA